MASLHLHQDILNIIYPVGSIYMSTKSTNPKNLFGGTWEQIKDRFLLACGTTYSNGATGGASKVTHNHPLSSNGGANFRKYATKFIQGDYSKAGAMKGQTTEYKYWITEGNADTGTNTYPYTQANSNAGLGLYGNTDNKEISIMPPYLAVYVWKRTA